MSFERILIESSSGPHNHLCNFGRGHYGEFHVNLSLIGTSGSGKKKFTDDGRKPTTIAHLEPFNVIITKLYGMGDVVKIKQAAG